MRNTLPLIRKTTPDVTDAVRKVLPSAGDFIALTEKIVGDDEPLSCTVEIAELTLVAARLTFVSNLVQKFLEGSGLLSPELYQRALIELGDCS